MVSQSTPELISDNIQINKSINTEIISEYQELNLSLAKDLEVFLDAVKDVHADATQFLSIAQDDNYKSLDSEEITGEEVFRTLNEKSQTLQAQINDCRDKMLPNGDEIPDGLITEMQTTYNDMLLLLDYISDTYNESFPQSESVEQNYHHSVDCSCTSCDQLNNENMVEEYSDIEIGPKIRRKKMDITPDDGDGDITITIAKHAEEAISSESPKTINHVLMSNDISELDTNIIANTESIDPINKIVEDRTVSHDTSDQNMKEGLLTTDFLKSEKYSAYIKSNYGSHATFEKKLKSIIAQIEAETMDAFGRWLGENKVSPFSYLKDMTLSEIENLAQNYDTRSVLNTENIKYETFITWIDLIPEMREIVDTNIDLTLGDLFARWMIESELQSLLRINNVN